MTFVHLIIDDSILFVAGCGWPKTDRNFHLCGLSLVNHIFVLWKKKKMFGHLINLTYQTPFMNMHVRRFAHVYCACIVATVAAFFFPNLRSFVFQKVICLVFPSNRLNVEESAKVMMKWEHNCCLPYHFNKCFISSAPTESTRERILSYYII